LTGSSGSMCILLSPQTTTLTGCTGSMYILLSPQTTTLTGSSGSMCILLSPDIMFLFWKDSIEHILYVWTVMNVYFMIETLSLSSYVFYSLPHTLIKKSVSSHVNCL
jgi:hypothetical protein